MKKRIEFVFGKTAKTILFTVNPIKKLVISTKCMAHKYINNTSIELLKDEKYMHEYNFFCKYKAELNSGVTWADQDFKSSNHFYHFQSGKGLYGFSNALEECTKYYNEANIYLEIGDIKKAVFYFGAACHLLQDVTVPQHANKRLLKSHRKFELWIISKITLGHKFGDTKEIKICKNINDYIKSNAIMANRIWNRYSNIENGEKRYMKVADSIIKEAKMTTAGFMTDFYKKLKNKVEY